MTPPSLHPPCQGKEKLDSDGFRRTSLGRGLRIIFFQGLFPGRGSSGPGISRATGLEGLVWLRRKSLGFPENRAKKEKKHREGWENVRQWELGPFSLSCSQVFPLSTLLNLTAPSADPVRISAGGNAVGPSAEDFPAPFSPSRDSDLGPPFRRYQGHPLLM
jgi:hypothetical protein